MRLDAVRLILAGAWLTGGTFLRRGGEGFQRYGLIVIEGAGADLEKFVPAGGAADIVQEDAADIDARAEEIRRTFSSSGPAGVR